MYEERMRRNLRPLIEEAGFDISPSRHELKSISPRHLYSVEKGEAQISLKLLEAVADETGIDMLDFFQVKVPFK